MSDAATISQPLLSYQRDKLPITPLHLAAARVMFILAGVSAVWSIAEYGFDADSWRWNFWAELTGYNTCLLLLNTGGLIWTGILVRRGSHVAAAAGAYTCLWMLVVGIEGSMRLVWRLFDAGPAWALEVYWTSGGIALVFMDAAALIIVLLSILGIRHMRALRHWRAVDAGGLDAYYGRLASMGMAMLLLLAFGAMVAAIPFMIEIAPDWRAVTGLQGEALAGFAARVGPAATAFVFIPLATLCALALRRGRRKTALLALLLVWLPLVIAAGTLVNFFRSDSYAAEMLFMTGARGFVERFGYFGVPLIFMEANVFFVGVTVVFLLAVMKPRIHFAN